MRIIYSNLWDLYTLTESQEDANYPVENTQDTRLVKVWRTDTASASTIVLDAGTGSTITADSCAVINHNFSGSSETKIQAHASDSWGSPSVSTVVTFRAGTMVLFFTSASFRFWRFSFDDTTNTDGFYEVGRLMLGEYLQVDPSSLVEFPEKHVRNDNVAFSRSNQHYADQGSGWKELSYQFQDSDDTMKGKVEVMWGSVGKFIPILLMNYDTTFTVVEPLYASITNDLTFGHKKFDRWDYSINLREAH